MYGAKAVEPDVRFRLGQDLIRKLSCAGSTWPQDAASLPLSSLGELGGVIGPKALPHLNLAPAWVFPGHPKG